MKALGYIWPVFKREFAAYFATPQALAVINVFLIAAGVFTFYVGRFYDAGMADLSTFFVYHPWLYIFLVPAISMRLWAEERRTGTMELLLTLPIPIWATVVGKYLAAWALIGVALLLTFPIWLTVNYLGSPDNGVILAGYVGSFLMAGAYLAIGACLSAATNNQIIAFISTASVCFLFTFFGPPVAPDWLRDMLPQAIVRMADAFSFPTHFISISRGVLDLRDLVFFFSLIALFLAGNVVLVDTRRAG